LPELPEVEVVRLGLTPHLVGQVVQQVAISQRQLRWLIPSFFEQRCQAHRIEAVSRRGKYLLLHFTHGHVLVHLGMSGSLTWIPRSAILKTPMRPHDHVKISFALGELRYYDPRRFGAWVWHDNSDGPVLDHPLLARLGVEPLESVWDGSLLYAKTRGKSAAIKQVLLAGQIVVGVGNIYASEALFRAQIRPTVAAGRISLPRYQRLAQAIKDTLSQAVTHGGSTLRDFVNASGASGYFQISHAVYDRGGLPCQRCSGAIRTIRQGQRSTFYCPQCQN
jgi:formamidopyrimidine-DNA glycosylase